jgi:hypothetical protein
MGVYRRAEKMGERCGRGRRKEWEKTIYLINAVEGKAP